MEKTYNGIRTGYGCKVDEDMHGGPGGGILVAYPAPFSVRLVLDRGDIGKIADVEIVPKRSTVVKMAPAYKDQIRGDIFRALKCCEAVYMTGIYIGEDGSMGFRRGQTYRFRIMMEQRPHRAIVIRTEEGLLRCPYSSIDALLRYWHPLYMWNSERDNDRPHWATCPKAGDFKRR